MNPAHKDRLYLAGQFTAVRTIAIMQETFNLLSYEKYIIYCITQHLRKFRML